MTNGIDTMQACSCLGQTQSAHERGCPLFVSQEASMRDEPLYRKTEDEYERMMFGIAERAYFKAAETSDPQDWLHAGLIAQQHRNALTRARAAAPAPTSPQHMAVEAERIAELQYEAGMYKSLYEHAISTRISQQQTAVEAELLAGLTGFMLEPGAE